MYPLHSEHDSVASFCFNNQGIILDANFAGAQLLNVSRYILRDKLHAFATHLIPDCYGTFFNHIETVFGSDDPQVCSIHIVPIGQPHSLAVGLRSQRSAHGADVWQCVTLITESALGRQLDA